jgi:hypothetical protein
MKYQSKQLKAIHESAKDLFEIGAISAARMREYDVACLVPKAVPHRDDTPAPRRPAVILPTGGVAGVGAHA